MSCLHSLFIILIIFYEEEERERVGENNKKALLRAVPIKAIVRFGWQFLRLAPIAQVCYPIGHFVGEDPPAVCVVVVHSCLQPRLIRYEWGTSFFDVGASLKNCSHRLKKTKPCRSFEPKVDKLLAGLDSFLPHKKHKKALLRVVPIKGIVHFG